MQKYTVDDYIVLIQNHLDAQDRLSQIFESRPSEEEQAEQVQYQALLQFLNDIKNNFSDIMENALKATLENFTAEKFLESIEKKNESN